MSERASTYVFDIHPLIEYSRQRTLVMPSLISAAVQREWVIVVSALTLAEAYRAVSDDEALVLDLLAGGTLMALSVTPFDVSLARGLGRQSASTGLSLATLHTVELAAGHSAGVVTGDVAGVRSLLGPGWPIVEL